MNLPHFYAYLRVSTDRQTTDHQEQQVKQLLGALRKPLTPFEEESLAPPSVVREVESGAKARPELRELCNRLRAGDTLAVWALDRLGRNALEMVNTLRALLDRGVRVVSVQEPWIDQPGPVRDLLVFVFAWVAEQERRRLVERTKAGLVTARAKGHRLGRKPEVDPDQLEAAVRHQLGAAGKPAWKGDPPSIAHTAKRFGVPRTSLRRALAKRVAKNPLGTDAQKQGVAMSTDLDSGGEP